MILSLDLCAYLCTLLEKLETEQLGDHFVDFLFDFPDKTCPISVHYKTVHVHFGPYVDYL